MKKFKYVYNKYVYILVGINFLIFLAAIIFNILRLSGVGDLYSHDRAMDITSIIIMITLSILIILMLLFSNYKINDKTLDYNVFFIPIAKLNYENILAVQCSKKKATLALYYRVMVKDKEEIKYMLVSIKPESFEEFFKELKAKNSKIIYEDFTENDNTYITNSNPQQ